VPVVTEGDVDDAGEFGEVPAIDRLRAVERERAERPSVERPLEGDAVGRAA
jgi:hypothetical protein